MTDTYLGCGCHHVNDTCCTWKPIFSDTSPAEIHVDMCDEMRLDLGSDVKPVIGTANDYALADNKPSINGVTLIGNKTNEEINIGAMSNMDIERILNSFI